MRKMFLLFSIALLLSPSLLTAAPKASDTDSKEIAYYLPQAASYDPQIPQPAEILGYQVGQWHVRPEQLDRYFHALAKASPRVMVKTIGYSHEMRPLIHVFISSPDNLAKLEQIRSAHLAQNTTTKQSATPMITWMGYSVHGNEASGSNASMVVAYHLAAAQDAKTLEQLKDQVIIIDPTLNPDGLARFASWVNSYKAKVVNGDPNNIEHREAWPRGRTNHYWFDLNRDWLLLQHPESRARITQFHRWRPHVLTDFHEMGTNSTYFFQPGVPSRQNPLTSSNNFNMTAKIAEYHAKALDQKGSLYYSKESFDDFYYGKGSTYPDIHGTVGILFEQASARGHLQDSDYGPLSFPFAIRNHVITSFSTIEAVQQSQAALKAMQKQFYQRAAENSKDDRMRAVVVGSHDQYRLNALSQILSGHQIAHYRLAENLTLKGQRYVAKRDLIIPLRQPQYMLIKAMFETRTEFNDTVFYDVSAWNLAMAMDLDFDFVSRSDFEGKLLGDSVSGALVNHVKQPLTIDADTLAIAFDWNNMQSAKILSELLRQELTVLAATKATQLQTESGVQSIPLGSIIVPLTNQKMPRAAVVSIIEANAWPAPMQIKSGLAINGVDMGSPSLPVIKPIKPLLLVGEGTSSYSAGEVWHHFDTRLEQSLTMIDHQQLKSIAIDDYTHLIIAGNIPKLNEKTTDKVEKWLKAGGILITHSQAAKWALEQGWTSSEVKEFDKPVDTEVAYSQRSKVAAEHFVGGAITHATIDTSHPLGFGLDDQKVPLFKRGNLAFTEAKESFVSIARFNEKPLATGYMSQENQAHIKGETSILIQGVGQGRVVAFSDNPLFRGYFLGSARIFNNALYFAKITKAPKKTKQKDKPKDTDVKKAQ